MNTKILRIALFSVFFSAFASHNIQAGGSDGAVGISLNSITTASGKTYRKVEVINADKNGLLFRHEKGTSKVDFKDLSSNLREMFQTETKVEGADTSAKPAETDFSEDIQSLEIETRSRITIYSPNIYYPRYSYCNPFDPATVNWRPYWGRYHYGLAYANFHCRQAAEQDFLIQSGIARHWFR